MRKNSSRLDSPASSYSRRSCDTSSSECTLISKPRPLMTGTWWDIPAFQQSDRCICTFDDIEHSKNFIQYMDEMLDSFQEDKSVCMVTGYSYPVKWVVHEHCNVVKHGENGHLRQKGKSCELACGYGGSTGAMISMGALESGMKEEELKPLVDAWREANPHIVRLWGEIESAAMKAVSNKTSTETHGIKFICKSECFS